MDAIKSILSPLGMGTGAIQDTLVTIYTIMYLVSFLDISLETRGHWRNCGNCTSSFNVCLEWLRRLSVTHHWLPITLTNHSFVSSILPYCPFQWRRLPLRLVRFGSYIVPFFATHYVFKVNALACQSNFIVSFWLFHRKTNKCLTATFLGQESRIRNHHSLRQP